MRIVIVATTMLIVGMGAPQPPGSRRVESSFMIRSMEACRVHLTEAGRRASFVDMAVYEATMASTVTLVLPLGS